ncbi:MAG: hypothetical protein L0Y50_05850 [Beijerinckiaceae bacterium]|nr:hypothetical protein [Beijerinckiaceae bacterium]MCI0735782.1 hypothetical protein [Beijerinckiaceae bacterium]
MRQFFNHGHVKVKGRRVNISTYRARIGDTIKDDESSRQLTLVLEARQLAER